MSGPSAGRIDGREHRLPVRVYYEDTDLSGLVYHAGYLRFMERGRSDFLRLAGVRHAELLAQGLAFAVTRMEIDFGRAARIDDALEVRTAYEALKGPRIFVGQRIERGGDLVCAARAQVACIDLSGRARRPPGALLAALRPYLVP